MLRHGTLRVRPWARVSAAVLVFNVVLEAAVGAVIQEKEMRGVRRERERPRCLRCRQVMGCHENTRQQRESWHRLGPTTLWFSPLSGRLYLPPLSELVLVFRDPDRASSPPLDCSCSCLQSPVYPFLGCPWTESPVSPSELAEEGPAHLPANGTCAPRTCRVYLCATASSAPGTLVPLGCGARQVLRRHCRSEPALLQSGLDLDLSGRDSARDLYNLVLRPLAFDFESKKIH